MLPQYYFRSVRSLYALIYCSRRYSLKKFSYVPREACHLISFHGSCTFCVVTWWTCFPLLASRKKYPLLLYVHKTTCDANASTTGSCYSKMFFSSYWSRVRLLCDPCSPVAPFGPWDAFPKVHLPSVRGVPPYSWSVWNSLWSALLGSSLS